MGNANQTHTKQQNPTKAPKATSSSQAHEDLDGVLRGRATEVQDLDQLEWLSGRTALFDELGLPLSQCDVAIC